jgi:hypothetical protein
MKIGIAADNSVALHTPSFVNFIKRHASKIECQPLTSRFSLTSSRIEYHKAIGELGPEIKNEMDRYDLSLLVTTKPYINNFFYTESDKICILSCSGWSEFTTLPMSNGVAFIMCEIIIGLMGIGPMAGRGTSRIHQRIREAGM